MVCRLAEAGAFGKSSGLIDIEYRALHDLRARGTNDGVTTSESRFTVK